MKDGSLAHALELLWQGFVVDEADKRWPPGTLAALNKRRETQLLNGPQILMSVRFPPGGAVEGVRWFYLSGLDA